MVRALLVLLVVAVAAVHAAEDQVEVSIPPSSPVLSFSDTLKDLSLLEEDSKEVSTAAKGKFGPCKTCVFTIERIKKGTNMLLPSICAELYQKYQQVAYAHCHEVLNALSTNGNNVRYWLFEGCYKYEIYQAKEWVKPCPSHVMCSVLKSLNGKPFCKPLPMENPFK